MQFIGCLVFYAVSAVFHDGNITERMCIRYLCLILWKTKPFSFKGSLRYMYFKLMYAVQFRNAYLFLE